MKRTRDIEQHLIRCKYRFRVRLSYRGRNWTNIIPCPCWWDGYGPHNPYAFI